MSIVNLRRFLADKLLLLDPSLSDTPGAPMYQKVIEPLMERLSIDPLNVDVETFIINRLKDDPLTANLDVESAGSFLKDMLVRPLQLLMEPLQREIIHLKRQQSILYSDTLNSSELEALLANILLTRNFGSYAFGSIRVYYQTPRVVNVDASILFTTAQGLAFQPPDSTTFTEGDFVQDGQLYYIEIETQSLIPHLGANVKANTIRFVQGLSDVVQIINPAAFSGGMTQEDDASLLARAETSLTERSLNTKRGVEAALFSNYTNLRAVTVIGYKDPEMQRDILKGTVTTTLELTGEFEGSTLLAALSVSGFSMLQADADPDANLASWDPATASTFPFTNVVQLTYPDFVSFTAAYEKIVGADYIKIFSTGAEFDLDLLPKSRRIKYVKAAAADDSLVGTDDPTARKVRVILEDFVVLFQGGGISGSFAETVPNDNAHGDQGPSFSLKPVSDWRGAPLPMTDKVFVGEDVLVDYIPVAGRDYLVLAGHPNDPFSYDLVRSYPIRRKLDNSNVQVRRQDSTINDRLKIGLPLTFSTDTAKTMEAKAPEILAFGGPSLGDPRTQESAMFSGKTTPEGYGGACLIGHHNDTSLGTEKTYIGLKPDPSRPNGWADVIGDPQNTWISIAGFQGNTENGTPDTFDFWTVGRISDIAPYGSNFLEVKGMILPDRLAGEQEGDFSKVDAHAKSFLGFRSYSTNVAAKVMSSGPIVVSQLENGQSVTFEVSNNADATIIFNFGAAAHTFPSPTYRGGRPASRGINQIRYVANYGGDDGNIIQVTTIDPGAAGVLSMNVQNSTDVFIYLAHDGANPTSTAQEIVNAILDDVGGGATPGFNQEVHDLVGNPDGVFDPLLCTRVVGVAGIVQAAFPSANLVDGEDSTINFTPGGGALHTFLLDNLSTNLPTTAPTPEDYRLALETKFETTYPGAFTWTLNGANQLTLSSVKKGTAQSWELTENGLANDFDFMECIGAGVAADVNETGTGDAADNTIVTPTEIVNKINATPNLPLRARTGTSGFLYADHLVLSDVGGAWGWESYIDLKSGDASLLSALKLDHLGSNATGTDLTGTASLGVGADANKLFGIGTKFTEELIIGDFLTLDTLVRYIVYTIESDTELTLTAAAVEIVANATPHKLKIAHGYASTFPFDDPLFIDAPAGFAWGFPNDAPYRLHWTVFRNEHEVLLPNLNLHTSYTNLAFPPCFEVSTEGTPNPIYSPSMGLFTGFPVGQSLQEKEILRHLGHSPLGADTYGVGNSSALRFGSAISVNENNTKQSLNNRVNWAIVRLDQDFRLQKYVGGNKVIANKVYPALSMLNWGNASNPSGHRFLYADSVNSDNLWSIVAGTGDVLPFMHTSPFSHLSHKWTGVGDVTMAYEVPSVVTNPVQTDGFSLIDTINAESKEFVMVMKDSEILAEELEGNTSITLSDIPGSFPFTEEFGEVTVKSDEVHIGGMTDVYLKGMDVDTSSAEFKLTPDTITPGLSHDVIFEASDGVVDADGGALSNKHISSVSLTEIFNSLELADSVRGMTVQILEAIDNSLEGKVFKVLGEDIIGSSNIRLGSVINSGDVQLVNVGFRILRELTTELSEPRTVLQEGTDLHIPLESSVVTSATGFEDLSEIGSTIYLELLGGQNKGVYPILEQVGGSTLLIDGVLIGVENDIGFLIYTKLGGVEMPLVRLNSVEMNSGDGTGIVIPYAEPIEALAESFSGLNNDPVGFSDSLVMRPAGTYPGLGVEKWDPAHGKGTYLYAQLLVANIVGAEAHNWEAAGIIPFDVVKIADALSSDLVYFWVRDISGGVEAGGVAGDENKVLVLDRDIEGKFFGLSGLVGKPSVGDVEIRFLSPTYAEVTSSDTVFTHESENTLTSSFRPSPAETAVIYSSFKDFTDVKITPDPLNAGDGVADTAVLSTSSLDFESLKVKVGDNVTFSRRVIKSSLISADTTIDMTNLIGKTLVLHVNGIQKNVYFTSVSGLTFQDVVNQINDQVGGHLTAVNDVDAGGGSYLKLYSSANVLEIKDSSPNVLFKLGLVFGQNNSYGVTSVSTVTELSFDHVAEVSSLTLSDPIENAFSDTTEEVFVTISRPGSQNAFPASMVQDDNGFYVFTITVSSREPLTTSRLPENTQLSIEGLKSLGYKLSVHNSNYSYSAAEKTDFICTPTVLDATATDFTEEFATHSTDLVINYERSQLVYDIQSFMLSDYDRVVCNNPLARHYCPAYLYLSLIVNGGPSTTALKTALAYFMATLYPNRTLEAFDIQNILAQQGVDYVQHPITMIYLTHDKDRKISVTRAQDTLTIDDTYHIMEDMSNVAVSGS